MKEKIEARIEELKKAKSEFLANINYCEGAIVELSKLIKEEEKPKDSQF